MRDRAANKPPIASSEKTEIGNTGVLQQRQQLRPDLIVTVLAFNSRARIPLSATVIFNVMVEKTIGGYLAKRSYTEIEEVGTQD